jgi:periplasmic protein TonB
MRLALAVSILLHLGLLSLPFVAPREPVATLDAVTIDLLGDAPAGVRDKDGKQTPPPAAPSPAPAISSLPALAPLAAFIPSTEHIEDLSELTYPDVGSVRSTGSGTGPQAGTAPTDAAGTGGDSHGSNQANGSVRMHFGSGDGPRFSRKALPEYPARAKRMRLTGSVGLLLSIDERGKLTGIEVTSPAGHGFDEEAVRAVRRSSFHPATKEGAPVPCTAKLMVRFEHTD